MNEALSSITKAWLDLTWKGAVLLGSAWFLGLLLKRPAARHLASALALCGTILAPIVGAIVPQWPLPILAGTPVIEPPAKAVSVPLDLVEPGPREDSWSAASGFGVVPIVPMPPELPLATSTAAAVDRAVSAEALAIVLWALVASLAMVPLVAAWGVTWRLRRRSTLVADPEWLALAKRLAESLGHARSFQVRLSEVTEIPLTFGWLDPVILLPRDAGSWTEERRKAVLLHELAHIQRRDCLTQQWAHFACALQWHDPFAWLAASRMKRDRERACDDAVLLAGVRPSDYARELLHFAQEGQSRRLGSNIAAVAMARSRGSAFEARVASILEPGRGRSGLSRLAVALGTSLAIALTLGLSSLRLEARTLVTKVLEDAPNAIKGRVFSPSGKAAAKAALILTARKGGVVRGGDLSASSRVVTLGEAETDADGAYELKLPQGTAFADYNWIVVMARTGDQALGARDVDPDSIPPSFDIPLLPTVERSGVLQDVDGKPLAGVKVDLKALYMKSSVQLESVIARKPSEPSKVWEQAATTDASGRYTIRGIPLGGEASVWVDDPKYMPIGAKLAADPADGSKPVEPYKPLTVQPSRFMEGIIRGDVEFANGLPNASLTVYASSTAVGSWGGRDAKTDGQGRFRTPIGKGPFIRVTAYPPEGSPYLVAIKERESQIGEPVPPLDFTLPKGVLIEGRVTEQGTGKPLSGASLQYYPLLLGKERQAWDNVIKGWQAAVITDADGRFKIAVIPGRGHLLVHAANDEYVLKEVGSRVLDVGKPGGVRKYAHAIVPYDVKLDRKPEPLAVELKKGITINGTIAAPDGSPVVEAIVLDRLNIHPLSPYYRGFPRKVQNGKFTIRGVDPEGVLPIYVLDPKNQWGATLEIVAKTAANAPVAVKLSPCGKARVRLVDEQGKPYAKMFPMLHLAVTPGPSEWDDTAISRGELAADTGYLPNVDRTNYGGKAFPLTDDDGRCVVQALIPGANYRIVPVVVPEGAKRVTEFTVKAVETVDVPDVVVKRGH